MTFLRAAGHILDPSPHTFGALHHQFILNEGGFPNADNPAALTWYGTGLRPRACLCLP